MGDQDEFAAFDLGMADADPAGKPVGIQAGMALQGCIDEVDDEMEEIGLVPGIAAAPREDHPVGTPGGKDLNAQFAEPGQEMTARPAVSGRLPFDDTAVHALVIEGEDFPVERGIDGRLQDGQTVEIHGQAEQAAGPRQRDQPGQDAGGVDQVQEGVGDQEIPVASPPLPLQESVQIDGLKTDGDARPAPFQTKRAGGIGILHRV